MDFDLSPLSTHMDLGVQKHNTYATFFSTLHSRSTPSDYFFAKIEFPLGSDFANFVFLQLNHMKSNLKKPHTCKKA